jgi:hypothetical protein
MIGLLKNVLGFRSAGRKCRLPASAMNSSRRAIDSAPAASENFDSDISFFPGDSCAVFGANAGGDVGTSPLAPFSRPRSAFCKTLRERPRPEPLSLVPSIGVSARGGVFMGACNCWQASFVARRLRNANDGVLSGPARPFCFSAWQARFFIEAMR